MKFFRFISLLVALFFWVLWEGYAQQAPRVLETTAEVRALGQEEAGTSIAVALEGTIAHCTAYEVTYCTLRDETGSVLIRDVEQLLTAGTFVSLLGTTEPGWITPRIAPDVEVVSRDASPEISYLSTVEEVRKLSPEESSQAFPVRLTGVITYCTLPDTDAPHCFMQDETGGIYFNYFSELPAYGTRIQLTGVTLRGWFAPDIAPGARLVELGEGEFPLPSANPDFYLLKGKDDATWVDAVGVVQQSVLSKRESHLGLVLELATNDNEFITVFVNSKASLDDLVGAIVRIQGVAGGFFNPDRQLTGIRLQVPDTSFIEVLSPGFKAMQDKLTLRPLNKVLTFSLNQDEGHMVRVAGTVTYRKSDYFIIQDAHSAGIVYSRDNVHVGDSIHAIGFPEVGGLTPTLINAEVQPLGRAKVQPSSTVLRVDSLENPAVNGSLVEITGELQEVIELQGMASYLIKADGSSFEALIDGAYTSPGFRTGSTVKLTGIAELLFNPRYDDVPEVHPLRLKLRSTADMELIEAGPWWTPARTRWLSLGLLFLLAIGGGWTVLMRRQIHDQTRTIRDKLEEVNLLKDEAEVASRAKSAFLASMSHEIRTPLNGVIGFTSLLKDTPLNEEQQDFVSTIHTSGDALLSIINDILDFSKIEAGKLDLESRPFFVHHCIEDALDIVSHRAFAKGLDLGYYIDASVPPAIMGDVTRLRQVIINLLSNGIKFTSQGEVNVYVTAKAVDDQYELVFSVIDTGIGIPEDRQKSIFESFSQADSSTTRRFGGTGLGLAICRRLAELMGGHIWVESVEGAGSTFSFTIMASSAALQTEALLAEKQHVLDDRRVLIVDDNETNRKLLLALCQQWNMQAVVRSSATEVMEANHDFASIDVALLDYMMPRVDGGQLADYLREQRFSGPILIISSSGDHSEKRESVDRWLNKPIKQQLLKDVIIKTLESHVPRVFEETSMPEVPAPSHHSLRIAMAEKNRINMKISNRLLDDLGYRAEAFSTADALLENLQASVFDLAIVDEDLFTDAGINVLDELALGLDKKHFPRLVVLTNSELDVERPSYEHIAGYLSKPINKAALKEQLEATPRRFPAQDVPHPES